jgi:hypothetical protein
MPEKPLLEYENKAANQPSFEGVTTRETVMPLLENLPSYETRALAAEEATLPSPLSPDTDSQLSALYAEQQKSEAIQREYSMLRAIVVGLEIAIFAAFFLGFPSVLMFGLIPIPKILLGVAGMVFLGALTGMDMRLRQYREHLKMISGGDAMLEFVGASLLGAALISASIAFGGLTAAFAVSSLIIGNVLGSMFGTAIAPTLETKKPEQTGISKTKKRIISSY